jgi:hypothetical protein
MASAFGPFKRTAKTMFQPTSEAMKGFTKMGDSYGATNLDDVPAFHDVSEVPTRRPPTNKVFKVATKNVRTQQDQVCSKEFSALMSCVAMDEKGTTCADCYESLKACLGSTGANSEVSGLTSKKYHIERVYGGFGSQTRQRRGKGQKS